MRFSEESSSNKFNFELFFCRKKPFLYDLFVQNFVFTVIFIQNCFFYKTIFRKKLE